MGEACVPICNLLINKKLNKSSTRKQKGVLELGKKMKKKQHCSCFFKSY